MVRAGRVADVVAELVARPHLGAGVELVRRPLRERGLPPDLAAELDGGRERLEVGVAGQAARVDRERGLGVSRREPDRAAALGPDQTAHDRVPLGRPAHPVVVERQVEAERLRVGAKVLRFAKGRQATLDGAASIVKYDERKRLCSSCVADDFDVLIAGGGIAGLTAGLTAARLGRSVLVLIGGAPGGLLLSIERIDGYPGFPDGVPGYELCPLAQEQAAAEGAEFSMGELTGLEPEGGGGWLVATSEGDRRARAVVLATGARLKELGVPGEERLRGHGVSHCASCDAPLLRDRVVAVVGGGDSALQEALTLADSVSEVILVQRGETLSAQAVYRRRALEHPKIGVRYGTGVEEILGEQTVTGVRLAGGSELEVGAVFVYVGLQPNAELVSEQLRLDADGRVPTDESMRTELPGLLAAGIVRRGAAGRAAASAGDGAAAATAADRYLAGEAWPEPAFAHSLSADG